MPVVVAAFIALTVSAASETNNTEEALPAVGVVLMVLLTVMEPLDNNCTAEAVPALIAFTPPKVMLPPTNSGATKLEFGIWTVRVPEPMLNEVSAARELGETMLLLGFA